MKKRKKENRGEYLTMGDLALLTAESSSIWRKRVGRNELPHSRFGFNIRVKRIDLERWIAARSIPASVAEADNPAVPEAVLQ